MKEGAIIHRFPGAGAYLRSVHAKPLDSRKLKSQGSALRRSGYPHEGR